MRAGAYTLLLSILLSGCALSPGMNMESLPSWRGITITPITANLVQEQNRNAAILRAENSEISLQQNDSDTEYKIGPQDILSITVWDHPELTIPAGSFRTAEEAGHLVDDSGHIFYPYVGRVKVAGKTIGEVRDTLTAAISRKVVRPQLDVRVIAYRSKKVYITGEVTTPGPQFITDIPLTLMQAINQAGNLTDRSDMVNVTLTRDGKTYPINLLAMYEQGDLSQNILLKDRDTLYIPSQDLRKVFVLGEVQRPSSILMPKGRISLAEAISDAGGVNRLTSKPEQIFVIRNIENETTPAVYQLNGKSPDSMILGDQFMLKPRDIVYVETAGITRWNRVIQQLVPTTTLLNNSVNTDYLLSQ